MWGKLAVGLIASLAFATRVDAGPALSFDASDGRIYAEDQDDQWHPASLSKILTAYVVFEALRDGSLTLDTRLRARSLRAANQPHASVWSLVRK